MKKVFWTTVFWIALVVLLWGYIRFFDNSLGKKISTLIVDEPETVIQTGTDNSKDLVMISDSLTKIENKLTSILQTLQPSSEATQTPVPYNTVTPLLGK